MQGGVSIAPAGPPGTGGNDLGSGMVLDRLRAGTSILGIGAGDLSDDDYPILEDAPAQSEVPAQDAAAAVAQDTLIADTNAEDFGDLSAENAPARASLLSFDTAVHGLAVASSMFKTMLGWK